MSKDLRRKCAGVHSVMATPFNASLDIDEAGLAENVEFLVKHGIAVVTPLGTTGEFFSLTVDEQKRVVSIVTEAATGRNVVVIPGATSNSTSVGIDLARHARTAGADGVLIAPPSYMPLSPAELIRHFQIVAAAVDIPIVVYYLPEIHGVLFDHDTLESLAAIPNIIGIKWCHLDPHPFLNAVRTFGERFVFFSGYGEYLATLSYQAGAQAMSSPMSNYAPEISTAIHDAGQTRDWEKLRRLSLATVELYDFSVRNPVGLALTKEGMKLRGLAAGPLRPPLSDTFSEDQRSELRSILIRLGVPVAEKALNAREP